MSTIIIIIIIPGQDNLIADFLSRGRVLPSEWTLHPMVMDQIVRTLGPLQVDLFASALNARLPRYCSRVQDPAAWRIDAFSFQWKGFRGYAFPPVSLIPRILRKIREDQARVVLIAPWWPRRNWFPELVGLLPGPPRTLPPSARPDSAADIADSAPTAERAAPDCVAIIRRTGTQAGLSDRAAALVASSRHISTCETYNSRLAGFFHWCESHGVDPRSAPIHHIADFLIALFDKGRTISTIKGHRSAIAAIHSGFADGTCVSTAPCLSNIMRALFLQRPPVRKLLPSWSLPTVLEALSKAPFEPLAEAS